MRGLTARGFFSATPALGFLVAVAAIPGCDDAGVVDPDHGSPASAQAPGHSAPGATHDVAGVQVADMMDQPAAGDDLYAADAAELHRTPNGFSVRVRIPTPEPGSYVYPDEAEEGHPEAFTLWIFADGTPFWGAGHVVGGSHLVLSGHVSKETEPFDGSDPLGEAIDDADVHITIAPHGQVDPGKLPDQIQTPEGTTDHWWHAHFD